MLNREELCQKAIDIITGDREEAYGDPEDSFDLIARFWQAYLNHKTCDDSIETWDVSVMMALMKIARIANGKFKEDSYIDAIGYLAIAGELEGMEDFWARNRVSANDVMFGKTAYDSNNAEKLKGVLNISEKDVKDSMDIFKVVKRYYPEDLGKCSDCEFFDAKTSYCRHYLQGVPEEDYRRKCGCLWFAGVDEKEEDIDE